MGENLHDIDKLFRDALDEHEELPPGKVWDALDSNLDKSNVIQIKRKYNNLKRLAVALLLLLLGTVIYEIQSKKTGKEIATNNKAAEKKGLNSSADKANVPAASSTAINSNASNSTNSSNAGKDSLNNLEQQAAATTGINTTTNSGSDPLNQQPNAAARIKNDDHKKNSKGLTEELPLDNNGAFKSPSKRA